MRVQASTISLAALGLLAPCAFAHAGHLAGHASTAHRTETVREHAHASSHAPQPSHSHNQERTQSHSPQRAHLLEHHRPSTPALKHAGYKASVHASAPPSDKAATSTRRHAAAQAASLASAAAPTPTSDTQTDTQPQQASIHVHHNRKAHLTPDAHQSPDTANTPAAASLDPVPHQASTADFLPDPPTSANPTITPGEKHPVKLTVGNAKPSVTVRPTKIVVKAAVEEIIPTRVIMPALYTSAGRLIIPPALKGSHEILIHQNTMADREGLDRVQDDEDLEQMRHARMLIALPASSALDIDERLPLNRRFCRPWTADFLTALSRAHYQRFHSALQVNSAVRTVEFQQRLIRTNGNAAPAEGSTASPHLTGQAVDLAKHGLSMTEIAWLRGYLLPLVQQGKVDVEEEFQQSCFHISVYRKYIPQDAPQRTIDRHHAPATALAAAVR